MTLVLKIWLTGLIPRLDLGLCLGVAETSPVIDLDISVSATRSNHTDLAKPNLLYKFSSEHAKERVPPKPMPLGHCFEKPKNPPILE